MNTLKEKIQMIMYTLDLLAKQYGYTELETAIAIWIRAGELDKSDSNLEFIYNRIEDREGSMLNEDIKDLIDFN